VSATYSVVVPVYNGETTLGRCLDSILSQTLRPSEVIVIDDASTDRTLEVLRAYEPAFARNKVGLIFERLQRNAGPAAARNRGARLAQSECIAFLDADDFWVPDKLAIVDRFASDWRNADLIGHSYSDPISSTLPEVATELVPTVLSQWRLLLRNPIQSSCAVVRRRVGPRFDESMRYCEDYDLWLRIAQRSQVVWLAGRPLTRLGRPQLSRGGLSGNTMGMRAGELRVYRRFCAYHWGKRWWLFPLLLVFSMAKHLRSVIRRRLRRKASV
jgi:teichuronic acid biosynthesis glycosyltransferase TuaG